MYDEQRCAHVEEAWDELARAAELDACIGVRQYYSIIQL